MIQNGTKVSVHYVGKFPDGTVFDSSEGRGALRFEIGSGQIIPGFENSLIGKNVGDKVVANVSPEEGYGLVNEEFFVKVSKDRMPSEIQVGQELQASTEQGDTIVFVKEIHEDHVIVDGNHPLAGKDLVFEIEVLEAE